MKHGTRIATFASVIALFLGATALGAGISSSHPWSVDQPARPCTGVRGVRGDVKSPRKDIPAHPTPYPTRPEDWPGEGVIRVFGWMRDNRNFFWTEREKKQGSIVFAGDSLTGNWKTLGKDFPGVLVANRGIGGDVSRGLLFRFQEDVLALHPKAIVILIGINDLTAKQPATSTLANIRSMLELKRSAQPDVPVVLCTVPPSANPKAPVDEQQRRFLNQGLKQLAKENQQVSLVDLYAAMVTQEGTPELRYFQPDQLHFSAAGQDRWKEVLQPVLQQAGAL